MNYEIKTLEDDTIELKLGDKDVIFTRDCTMEQVAEGVEHLLSEALGVSAFELCLAVVKEVNKDG